MADSIVVKNNAGTKVRYNNVDTLLVPAGNGEKVVFRRWNGATEITSASSASCHNAVCASVLVYEIETTATVTV